jgi:hypothetical protein
MRWLLLLLVLLTASCTVESRREKNYYVVVQDTTFREKYAYVFVDHRGDTVARLDSSKYYHCFTDTFEHFAVVAMRGRAGWWAIDVEQRPLFEVFNTGDVSPDEPREGLVRIVGSDRRLGFANTNGEIVIAPQFEIVSSFYNGRAIIGRGCQKVYWRDDNGKLSDEHWSIECGTYGYINNKGTVLRNGFSSYRKVQNAIGWKEPGESW